MTTKARRGFTLVELLIVIGIIALLIAILLPALNKARSAANMTACASNLRQLGQACFAYQAENGGYFPPAWIYALPNGSSPDLTQTRPPCLYGLLTALPVQSMVRCCPTALSLFPSTAVNPDWQQGQGLFTYKYSGIVGGVDNTNVPAATGAPQSPSTGYPALAPLPTGYNQYGDTVSPVWWARPLKYVPHSSDTILFADYPQVETFAAQTASNPGDNRGFKLTAAGTPGWMRAFWSPWIWLNTTTKIKHQTIGDSAPVHNIRPATGVLYTTMTDGVQTWPSLMGDINVCYCDGSVRAITITQGVYQKQSLKVEAQNDPTSGGAGYTMAGGQASWDSTRYDPNMTP